MHENTDYKFAELKNCCTSDIDRLERKISAERGRETILLAFEKK